jgi:transcriptional regulator NrdR family protein
MQQSSQKRIVKRRRHTEQYQRQKLEKSIHASCLSVRDFVGAAELTATMVCDHVESWLAEKNEVTSVDIRRIAGNALRTYSPDAAYVYETVWEY